MAAETTTLDAALAEREWVLRILREHEAEIRAQGVTRLRMLGSMARGEAGPESDVDLIADVDRSARFSLLDLVGLQYLLQDLLGREVDVGTTVEKMRPRMRRRFEAPSRFFDDLLRTGSAASTPASRPSPPTRPGTGTSRPPSCDR